MRKTLYIFSLCLLVIAPSYAIDLALVSYDGNYYSYGGSEVAGKPVGSSDYYYTYKPFEQSLEISFIEWLSDGAGGVYERPETPTFYYSGITFDNMADEVMLDDNFLQNVADLRNQFDNWVVNNVSEIADLSVIGISSAITKQHNIDVYNSVFGNAYFDEDKFSVWGTTLLNSMNKSGKYDFSANGLGVVLGADLQLSDTVLVGAGYSYSNMDADRNASDILFDSNSLFLYSKWQPNKFYLNAIVSYDFADYEYADGNFSNGNVSGLFASVLAGYNASSGISPEIGIRYTNIKLDQNSEYLKRSESDFYSVVAGINYEWALGDFTLGGRVMIEYDMAQQSNKIGLDILDYKYIFEIDDTDRPLGAEFGLWAGYDVGLVDLKLQYDIRLRSDFVNHTGLLSIKYAF